MGTSVFVDLIKGPKGRGEPEKITSSVDLMKNKLTLKLHSQELLRAALGLPVSHIIYKIPRCCCWPRLSVCSQVSEPRAGCHASGHSWRIHISFGLSSSRSGCSQWAVPSERLITTRNVTERTIKATLLPREAAVLDSALTEFWSRCTSLFIFCVNFIFK